MKIPPGELFNTYADVGEVVTIDYLNFTNDVTVISTTDGRISGVRFPPPKSSTRRLDFLRLAKTRTPIPSMNHCIVAWRRGISAIHDGAGTCFVCGKLVERVA